MDYSVLIVDDETELAESTSEYFNMFDIPSKCVFTAVEAMEFVRNNNVKLILLDINLSEKKIQFKSDILIKEGNIF